MKYFYEKEDFMEKHKYPMILGGRALIALIFVMSGLGKIAGWEGTAGYMTAKGMPAVPFFLGAAIGVEVLGGLSVLIGLKARWGALALFLFMIPTTLIFHSFWSYQGMEHQMQMINFMKNLAIMGGLLVMAAHGPGVISLDSRRKKRETEAPMGNRYATEGRH